jgi:hypothetical protein
VYSPTIAVYGDKSLKLWLLYCQKSYGGCMGHRINMEVLEKNKLFVGIKARCAILSHITK